MVEASAVKGGDGSGGDSVWAAIIEGEGVRSTQEKQGKAWVWVNLRCLGTVRLVGYGFQVFN